MSSPTVEDARRAKHELEQAIMASIKAYERGHNVTVDRVRLLQADMNDGSSHLTNVEVEVQL